jgi:phosphoribosylamine--glycine ligase
MGAFSPVDWVTASLVNEVEETIIKPTLNAMRESGITYRGTIFSGIMMDQGKPHCLEFNVRMGDPETQVIVARLGAGFLKAFHSAAIGEFIEEPEVLNNAVVSVVIASEHYPILSSKGSPITISEHLPGVKYFHAGTAMIDGQLVTNGGRVINATACASNLREARKLAYRAAAGVRFEGARYRTDIGAESTNG